ncbi:hypothetical protein NKI71_16685 [Mesorhizobium sp. M0510]|uniref:hypothetical protein n=1 Tax=unclassified Mesorhizobium TaxID=325217 RepID=UPI00333B865C
MKVVLLDAKSVARRVAALIEKHDHVSMAMAWGDLTPVAETLLANTAKFGSVLFGVDLVASDPDLIDRLPDVQMRMSRKTARDAFTPRFFISVQAPRPRRLSAAQISQKVALGRTWRPAST